MSGSAVQQPCALLTGGRCTHHAGGKCTQSLLPNSIIDMGASYHLCQYCHGQFEAQDLQSSVPWNITRTVRVGGRPQKFPYRGDGRGQHSHPVFWNDGLQTTKTVVQIGNVAGEAPSVGVALSDASTVAPLDEYVDASEDKGFGGGKNKIVLRALAIDEDGTQVELNAKGEGCSSSGMLASATAMFSNLVKPGEKPSQK